MDVRRTARIGGGCSRAPQSLIQSESGLQLEMEYLQSDIDQIQQGGGFFEGGNFGIPFVPLFKEFSQTRNDIDFYLLNGTITF